MAYNYEYPYTDPNRANIDWIIDYVYHAPDGVKAIKDAAEGEIISETANAVSSIRATIADAETRAEGVKDAIAEKGAETIETIPSDYSVLTARVGALEKYPAERVSIVAPFAINNGMYWRSDGTLGQDVATYHACEAPVMGGGRYYLKFCYGFDVVAVLWMRGGTVVKAESMPAVTAETTVDGIYYAPLNATSVRITGHNFYPVAGVAEYAEHITQNGVFEIPLTFTWNKFIDTALSEHAYNGRKFAKLEVSGGEKYLVQTVNYWEARGYILTDSHGIVLSHSSGTGISYVNEVVTIPENAYYMYINGYDFGGSENIDNKKIANFTHVYKYESRDFKQVTRTGIKWCAVGDSLTSSETLVSDGCRMPNYVDFIRDMYGIETINMGVSGTGYMNPGNTTTFVQRLANVPNDTDLVTIFGSFNDLWASGYTLGSITDSEDANTVYGAIKKCISILYSKRSDIRILFITPTPWYNANDMHSNNPKNPLVRGYVDAILAVAKWYGLPVVNLFDESGLHPWDSVYAAKWFLDGDGTHPVSEIHKSVIAPMISAKMCEMFNI